MTGDEKSSSVGRLFCLLSFCCLSTFVNDKNIVFHGNANTNLCIISVDIARKFKSKQQFSYKKATKNSRYSEYTESFIIGVTGFEPAASWSRTKHSTGLSHTPIACILYHNAAGLSIAFAKKLAFVNSQSKCNSSVSDCIYTENLRCCKSFRKRPFLPCDVLRISFLEPCKSVFKRHSRAGYVQSEECFAAVAVLSAL